MSDEAVVERARVLAGLKARCELADRDLFIAEEESRSAWQEYWDVRGDFRVGDIVQHPTLRGAGEWVIREVWCTAKGEVQFVVQEVREGVPKTWRRLGRDGLIRMVRRPA